MTKWFVLFWVLAASALCLAQSESATLSGRVSDPSGAPIVGADVVLTNTQTNVEQRTKTNGVGLYVFADVHPGAYRVAAGSPGFRVLIKEGLTLHVQDELAQNFSLTIGAISESMTVTADATPIDTTDASVSTVVDRNFAENLPMNGRSFQTLIELTPGVVLTSSNLADNGQFSVNGQRASSNYWMVDGVSASIGSSSGVNPGNGMGGAVGGFSAMGGTNGLVSVDALQEFRIQTSTYAPEFGRTPGGQISIVTRSGANQLHGTLFDYLRNDILDANDWFADQKGLPKPRERQNDFGGTLSGPILKDRTFFFFSYEGLRLRLPQVTLTDVPCDSTCRSFGNARTQAVPAMQPYLNAFPLPNGSEVLDTTGNPTGAAQFNASYSNPATLDAYSIRIDHKLSDRLSLFGRYNYSPSEFTVRGASNGLSALSVTQPSNITTWTATLGATLVVSPTVANDLRFNYSRVEGWSKEQLDNFGGAVPLTSLPFPSPFTSQNGTLGITLQSLGTGGTLGGASLNVGAATQDLQRQINIVDSLSVQRGTHSLKFGVDFRRLSPLFAPPAYSQGLGFFDVPSAETGVSSGASITASRNITVLFRNLGVFAQDTWRLLPRLTLTYGLRWDVDFAPSSLSGPGIPAVTGYNLTNLSQLAIAAAGTPPFRTTFGNVAPRLGMAYAISQRQGWEMVLRGGFGVFYDLVNSETGNAVGAGFPPFSDSTNLPSGTIFPYSPTQIAPPQIPPTATLAELYAFNPNLKQPYTLEWNVALQNGLGKNQSVSVSYVGAAGRRLLQTSQFDVPPTNPNIGYALLVDNLGISDYDALQVQFQRRLSHGFQALASYAWAHSIDTGSAGSTAIASNTGVPADLNGNRGPSDFDIRNAFSAAVTYDVPTPKINAFANAILQAWSLQSIVLARSAPPVDVSDSNFFLLVGGAITDFRPDVVPGQPLYLYGSQYPGGKAFNQAAFTDPPTAPCPFGLCPTRQGDVPRNFLRGFGATQWDFAVHRDFPIHESLKLQFRAEMFNVLNHPNFGPPNGAFGTSSFGLSSQMLGRSLSGFGSAGAGGLSPLYQIGGPRSIQLALKLQF
jgi:hypothetical protein